MADVQHKEAAHAHDGPSIRKIWIVFWVLFGITAIEFVIALVLKGWIFSVPLSNFLFISLTILKAFYIVAYFMHMKFEKMNLVLAVCLPMLFIVGFLCAMLFEGNFWFMIR